jgi:hypothetical protein
MRLGELMKTSDDYDLSEYLGWLRTFKALTVWANA